MALVLADRVQETGTANTTVSFTLTGAVLGFQSFAVIGDGNTTYYSAIDAAGNWEVGIGTYATSGTVLTRTTILSSSNSGSAVTFPGALNVFATYPSEKSVNLNAADNVSPLGTISSGTWQGSTVGVAYGGTGVTASSGANSVVLRDSNQNISINRLNQTSQTINASGGTTTLTAASEFGQTLTGTGGQTFKLPDATTLTPTTTFQFNNNATGVLTIVNNGNGAVGTVAAGGAAGIYLLSNATSDGSWDIHAYIPEGTTWGTNALALGSTVITGGTWNGGTIDTPYGGTGLTSFTSGGALYATSTSALTSGTLPAGSGGTGATGTPTNGQLLIGNGTGYSVASLGSGTGISTTTGSGTLTVNNTAPMVYPGSGIPNSTGTSWGTSYSVSGTGTTVALTVSPNFTTPILGTPTSGTLTNCDGLPLTTGVTGTLGATNGGTGRTSLTANNVILGNGTSAVNFVAPGTTGNVLTSNGTTWTSAAPAGGATLTPSGEAFTGSGTFTIPATVTRVKATIIGGGGNGITSGTGAGGGGGGGTAIIYLSNLTPGNTITVTVGGVGGTSSIASGTQTISTVSASGGGNGAAGNAAGGAGGTGSGGTINITGQGGTSGVGGTAASGGGSSLGGGGRGAGIIAAGSGSLGGGGGSSTGSSSGSGGSGIVFFEW